MFHRSNPRYLAASIVAASVVAASVALAVGASWGSYKDDGCRGAKSKQFSAILWGVPDHQSWEDACWRTPGLDGRVPDRCVNTGDHEWGEWDIPDDSCRP